MCYLLLIGVLGIAPGAPASSGGGASARSLPLPEAVQERQLGWRFQLGSGAAGLTSPPAGVHPLAYGRAHGLYRFSRHFAAGLQLGFLLHGDPDLRGRVLWELLTGPEVRALFPVGRWEPWLGLTAGYQQVEYRAGGPHAFAVGVMLGFAAGAHVFVSSRVALGLESWLYLPALRRSHCRGWSACEAEARYRGGSLSWSAGLYLLVSLERAGYDRAHAQPPSCHVGRRCFDPLERRLRAWRLWHRW